MKVMVLAAGRGARMRPLTDTVPKPLLEVAGQSLIERHLRRLAEAGFSEVVINLHHLGKQIERRLGAGERFGLRIQYSHEAQLQETAGGIMQALPLLGKEAFLLLNADVWTDIDFARLATALPTDADAHLVLVANAEHHPGGDFVLDGQGRIRLPSANQQCLTYSGIALMRPALFAGWSPGALALRPVLERAMAHARVSGELHAGCWSDIGTPRRLQALREQLERVSKAEGFPVKCRP